MSTVLLIIATLINGSLVVDAAYPQPDLPTCEYVATHAVVLANYPGKIIYCVETAR
jgi:hypothetical protein